MKEEIVKHIKSDKNPYKYNGDVLNLPSDLPSSNGDGVDTQVVDSEVITQNKPHRKKVYTYSYGR